MKNVKSAKTLMSFSGSSMNLSEMKKVNGGTISYCRVYLLAGLPCPKGV
jgi:hypothetical protein